MIKKEFNTQNVAFRLQKSGLKEQDAKAIAEELNLLEIYCSSKFTKISVLDKAMRHYLARIETKISAIRFEALKWFIGSSLFQSITFILIALLKLI